MRLIRGSCIVFVIFFVKNVALVCCDEELTIESSNDALGEVSIEAVDDDDPHAHSPPVSTSFDGRSSSNSEEPLPVSRTDETSGPTDNSKAVATVYPYVGGVVASNITLGTNGTNSTTNATTNSRYLRVKVVCSELYPELNNSSLNESATVEIVNMTYLLHGILVTNPAIKTRTMPSNCTIVLFYTHWCPWSAKAAPHFNALPRAFKNIRFAAIDSSIHTAINTYFGILSVPTVVLFYNGKILAKFNETTFNVNQFADFISTFTDQKPGIRLNVTSQDFIGPIPSVITKGPDWYLYLAWTFLVSVFIYYLTKTTFWHRILELIQNSWREAEAVASVPPLHHHYHQD